MIGLSALSARHRRPAISRRGPATQYPPLLSTTLPGNTKARLRFYALLSAGRLFPRRLSAHRDSSGYAAPNVSSVPFPISVNYLSKGFFGLFPPPSDEFRQNRMEIRTRISDATSDPPLIVSSHFWPSHDDFSAVYPDVDPPDFSFTIVECFLGLFRVVVAYRCACLHLD